MVTLCSDYYDDNLRFAKNEHPQIKPIPKIEKVLTQSSLPSNTSYLNIVVEHGASSSQASQMNPRGTKLKSEINSWFRSETTWNEAEMEISLDEVLRKEEEEKLSIGE
ncbi:hypothetical protein Tco_0825185 [Tanacetum coccineum]